MKHADHHTTAKSIIALLVLLLAFTVYMLFYQNKDLLMQSESLKIFGVFTALAFTFLVILLYLASKPHKSHSPTITKRKRR